MDKRNVNSVGEIHVFLRLEDTSQWSRILRQIGAFTSFCSQF